MIGPDRIANPNRRLAFALLATLCFVSQVANRTLLLNLSDCYDCCLTEHHW